MCQKGKYLAPRDTWQVLNHFFPNNKTNKNKQKGVQGQYSI